jgi:hypothetical protein
MQIVDSFTPVRRDVRYLRCEQKEQGINRHATHCIIRYLYPSCCIVMQDDAHFSIGLSCWCLRSTTLPLAVVWQGGYRMVRAFDQQSVHSN